MYFNYCILYFKIYTQYKSILLMERKYGCRQNLWQVSVDFDKLYGSILRGSIYSILYKFWVPGKVYY